VCAAVVELCPGCACRADGTDDLVAQLDHYAATKEHDMRQLGERRNRVLAFRAFSQGECVVFKGYARVCLVVRAIERVDAGTVAAQRSATMAAPSASSTTAVSW